MKTQSESVVLTYLIAAGSSLFFCSKGVFVKFAYQHGADTITILALRMGIALPFFVAVALLTSIKADRLDWGTWLRLAGLGFIGYYLSSVVNFSGLRYITVGLERIVLFTYPSVVILLGVIFRRSRWNGKIFFPLLVAYGGIVLAFMGEAQGKGNLADTAKGVGLVFTSAVTYAVFILFGAELARTVGAMRFTSITVTISCIMVLTHFGIVHGAEAFLHQSGAVYFHGAVLALFGTVIPSFLLGLGLKRAGSVRFAIIGSIGPVGTLILAWILLGEGMGTNQLIGFVLSLSGGLAVTLMRASRG